MKYKDNTRFLFLLLSLFLFTGCNDDSDDGPELDNCATRTENFMAITLDGNERCTEVGAAAISADDDNELSVIAFFGEGSATESITLLIKNASPGSFDLTEPGNGGSFVSSTQSAVYEVDSEGGSGTLTLTALTSGVARGTFSFTAIGLDPDTGSPTGEEIQITNGSFAFDIVD